MKILLVLTVLVGSALCEPPAHVGLSYGPPAAAYGAPGGYPTNLLALSDALIGPGGHHQSLLLAAPQAQSLALAPAGAYGAPVAAYGAPAATYGAPVASYGAPVAAAYGPPAGLTLNAGFALGDYATPVVKTPVIKSHYAPIVSKTPFVKQVLNSPVLKVGFVKQKGHGVYSHNYDHAPFKPIVKKPVYEHYGAPSSYSITPSISYGYSYKLVPTSHYGPSVSHLPTKVVKAPVHHHGHHHHHHSQGPTKTFDLNFGLDLGHQNQHHHH